MRRRTKRRIWLIWWPGLSLTIGACLAFAAGTALMQRRMTSPTMRLVSTFQEGEVKPIEPRRVLRHNGEYFILDYKTSRILIYDQAMKFKRSIGSVGAGPGEFFHPEDFVIKRGLIYIYDQGNHRIQVVDLNGEFISQFRLPYIRGLAVNSKGEIFVGQPEKGKLVSVYSKDGKLLRSFGELKSFSGVYGEQHKDKDAKYRTAINRVTLTIDSQDFIYVTFVVAPIIQKYTPEGELVFETRLRGPSIDLLTHYVVTEAMAKKIVVQFMGADMANLTTWESSIDPRNGNIFALLPDNALYVLNSEGKQVAVFTPRPAEKARGYVYSPGANYSNAMMDRIYKGKALMLGRITILSDGMAFMITLFPPYGIYQMELPKHV